MSAVFWPSCLPCSVLVVVELVVPDCPVPLPCPSAGHHRTHGERTSIKQALAELPVPDGAGRRAIG